MPQVDLEKRLAALEAQMVVLQAEVQKLVRPKDWRNLVGRFAGDELMKRIDEAGRKIREADRAKARRTGNKKRKVVQE